jgi:bifunctional non-homologous end joining protein LigD
VTWDELPSCELADFTLATVPARFRAIGDPGAGIDEAVGSLDALLELSARQERGGQGDAPWPPHYAKAAGEPPRVMPSRARARARAEGTEAARPAAAVVTRPAKAVGGRPTKRSPSPTRRRASTKPLVEIARAATKEEALAGFERWKARHLSVVANLEPADILVDSMRGRFTLWYRIRVNLEHVPVDERPPQEPLEVDYDPWAAMR